MTEFATTQWSLVAAAGGGEGSAARRALEELCRAYWYPLYAYVRYRGYPAEEARDLTQAFFVSILETGGIGAADRERGRFRSYLLGAMKHFLANEWHREQAKKRGGGIRFVEWDALSPEARYAESPVQCDDPDRRFDYEWAVETTAAALRSLRQEMEAAGKGGQFELLKGSLTGEDELPRKEVAARLEMSEGAVKVAVHRLRQQYRKLLRESIAETVNSEVDLEDEMRYLVEVLRQQ